MNTILHTSCFTNFFPIKSCWIPFLFSVPWPTYGIPLINHPQHVQNIIWSSNHIDFEGNLIPFEYHFLNHFSLLSWLVFLAEFFCHFFCFSIINLSNFAILLRKICQFFPTIQRSFYKKCFNLLNGILNISSYWRVPTPKVGIYLRSFWMFLIDSHTFLTFCEWVFQMFKLL